MENTRENFTTKSQSQRGQKEQRILTVIERRESSSQAVYKWNQRSLKLSNFKSQLSDNE